MKNVIKISVLGLFVAMIGCVPTQGRLMEEVVRQGGQVAKEKVRSDAKEKETQARAEAEIAREKERTEAAKARSEAELAREQKTH